MGDDFVQLSETGTNATPTLDELINQMIEEETPTTKKFLQLLNKMKDLIGVTAVRLTEKYFGGTTNELHWKNMQSDTRKQHIINYIYVVMGTFK